MQVGEQYDYEIFVIGGGSGGVALARQAAKGSYSVGLADFVTPSSQNNTWGVGGTCVNVGCIPKKLMHTSGLYGELRADIRNAGWDMGDTDLDGTTNKAFNWEKLVQTVQKHIKTINLSMEDLMMNSGVI